MKLCYLDCFSGISGDMLLGASFTPLARISIPYFALVFSAGGFFPLLERRPDVIFEDEGTPATRPGG